MFTNENYGQKVTSLFDMLKLAPPDQLQSLAQSVQQNPDSPEATALAMATQYQQQASSQQQQAPSQTVFQQKIAQLQQSMNPMQGGIADIGANQYAMQDASQQDPMRNAGIGAAPENAAPPQGAATGGLVALAQGGAVRHFFNGGATTNPYAAEELPELGTEEYPYEEEEEEEAPVDPEEARRQAEEDYDKDVPDSALSPDQAERLFPAKLSAPKQPKRDTGIVNPPRPGSSAERIQAERAQDRSLEEGVQDMMSLYGPSFALSPELQSKYENRVAEAGKDKWYNALTQGLGAALATQSPHLGQAVGAGLMAGAAGYQQGAKEESALQDQIMALQLAGEKEQHADKRAAVGMLTKQIADRAAADRKFAGQKELKLIDERSRVEQAKILMGGKGANTYAVTAEEIENIVLNEAKELKKDPHSPQSRLPLEEVINQLRPQVIARLKQQGAQFNPRSDGGGNPSDFMRGVITSGAFRY